MQSHTQAHVHCTYNGNIAANAVNTRTCCQGNSPVTKGQHTLVVTQSRGLQGGGVIGTGPGPWGLLNDVSAE